MELDHRKLKILQAIINDYIYSAEPVGSRTIAKKYQLGISSATIRNEMSDLEELGYLEQPHTSAGRIPSDKGYRLYVDKLMELPQISDQERDKINNNIARKIIEVEDVIRQSSRILSQLTNYTSLVLAPQLKQNRLKHVQLLPMDDTGVLVIVVTDSGLVKNTILRNSTKLSEQTLEYLTSALNHILRGMELKDINSDIVEKLKKEIFPLQGIIESIMPIITEDNFTEDKTQLYSDGVSNIFNFPEYNDIEKAKNFLGLIEEKKMLLDMLSKQSQSANQLYISIGKENKNDKIQDCSIVTATYTINGRILGSIGVIGPTRMDYSKAISIVKYMTYNLTDILSSIYNK